MNMIIHRGTKEIGGTCVELTHDGWRLIIDVGQPLVNKDGSEFERVALDGSISDLIEKKILPDITDFYRDSAGDEKTAVLISHSHVDHYGLAHFIHPCIPIYASLGSIEIIRISAIFLRNAKAPSKMNVINHKAPFTFGPFSIMPYPVDHSAPDAQAFEIEAGGKKVFYSGDFRAHGNKSYLFNNLLNEPPKNIDYLLLEGTMFGRSNAKYPDEGSVREALIQILSEDNPFMFFFCSSQNIDRIVSAYKASLKSDALFVIDLYTAFILHRLKVLSSGLPQHNWKNVRVKFWHHHKQQLEDAGEHEFINEVTKSKIIMSNLASLCGKKRVMIKANSLYHKITDELTDMNHVHFVWSLWSGYLDRNNDIKCIAKMTGREIQHIHTSGHATVEDLKRLTDAIAPKHLIPIHTFEPDMYQNIYHNILHLNDEQIHSL